MIIKTLRKSKCANCESTAVYCIAIKKNKRTLKIGLCKDCLTGLYFEISKIITPKSPINILNNFKR